MALFDMFKSKAENAIKNSVNSAVTQGINKATSAVSNIGNKKEKILFSSLSSSFEEFVSLPQAAMYVAVWSCFVEDAMPVLETIVIG